jgi:hypothetical protein
MQTEVTPEAQAAIETVKDRIAAFLEAVMRCTAADSAPEVIAAVLNSAGDAFTETRTYTSEQLPPDRHGDGLGYEAAAVPHHPHLLVVVARLAIECGEDGMLVLFTRRSGVWEPLTIRRSAPYEKVSGAYGWLRYAVSPPDSQGRWYLATARVTPWCTSAWQGLDYDLSRPGDAPERPRIFFKRRVTTYLDNEDGGAVTAEANRFVVRHDGSIADPDIVVRRHVEAYSVEGETVRRIHPVAWNVRDFADEWIASSWDEAGDWSAAGLKGAHSLLRVLASDRGLEYRTIRRCAPSVHEVAISADGHRPWYLLIRGEGPYRLERASRGNLRKCSGPDATEGVKAAGNPW